MFTDFTGMDINRLTREDLIEIVGTADGIRLYNAVHRHSKPSLTLFVSLDMNLDLEQITGSNSRRTLKQLSNAFHALYFENVSLKDLTLKLSEMLVIDAVDVEEILMIGPGGIQIRVSDQLVRNMTNDSAFFCEKYRDQQGRYTLVLRVPDRSRQQ
jgi:transcription factor CP2-like protein